MLRGRFVLQLNIEMKSILKFLFPLIAVALLLYIWSVSIQNNGGLNATFASGNTEALIYNIFKLAGLTAFTLVGFQVLTGPYMKFWEKLYGSKFYKFHAFEGIFTLIFAISHPILLLTFLKVSQITLPQFSGALTLGLIAIILMFITVSTAVSSVLLNRPSFMKKWHFIHLLNYVVFILVFAHSMTIGTDVSPAGSPLRIIWMFFFVGMLIGFIYKRFWGMNFENRREGQTNKVRI